MLCTKMSRFEVRYTHYICTHIFEESVLLRHHSTSGNTLPRFSWKENLKRQSHIHQRQRIGWETACLLYLLNSIYSKTAWNILLNDVVILGMWKAFFLRWDLTFSRSYLLSESFLLLTFCPNPDEKQNIKS